MGKDKHYKVKVKGNKFKIGEIVGLRSAASGRFVSGEPNGMVIGSPVNNGFMVVSGHGMMHHHDKKDKLRYGSTVALKTMNGKFLSIDPSGQVTAMRDMPQQFEYFAIVNPRNPSDFGKIDKGQPVALRAGMFFLACDMSGRVYGSPQCGPNESFFPDSSHSNHGMSHMGHGHGMPMPQMGGYNIPPPQPYMGGHGMPPQQQPYGHGMPPVQAPYGGMPPQQGYGMPPQQGYGGMPPQQGYPPQQTGYPPQNYPPQQGYPPQQPF